MYHAISRLLGQFETFGACWAGGESRDFVAATITERRGQACRHQETMRRFPREREEKVERRPQESGERRSEFSSALLSPFSTLLLYCRDAAMEAATKTRNGYRIGTCNVAGKHSPARPGGHLRGVTGRAAALSGVDACRITICAGDTFYPFAQNAWERQNGNHDVGKMGR